MRAALSIYVQPRSARTEIVGWHGDALKIRVAAPPVGGAANLELVRFLAEALEVPPSAVAIAKGIKARRKEIVISGLSAVEVMARLQRLLGEVSEGSGNPAKEKALQRGEL